MKKLKEFLARESTRLTLVFAVLVSLFTLLYLASDSVVSVDDAFFHIRFAQIFQHQGLEAFKDFKWIYFSKIAAEQQTYFVYYNFLFYLILIPFSWLTPPVLGLKLFGVFFGALALTILYYLLRKLHVKYAELWLLFSLAVLDTNIARVLIERPFALAPALLLLLLCFLYRKKYLAAGIISLLYFYWHPATFFFPGLVVGIYILFEKFWWNSVDWKKPASVFGATILGYFSFLIFAPGFTTYMKEVILKLLSYVIFTDQPIIPEGREVYGKDLLNYFHTNQLFFLLLIVLLSLEIYRYILYKRKSTIGDREESIVLQSTLFFLVWGFFYGVSVSFRYYDFFVFFALAYIPLALKNLWSSLQIELRPEAVKSSIKIALVVLVFSVFLNNTLGFYENLSRASNYHGIEQAALWLKNNTPDHSVIFNQNWSDFALLFYFDPDNYYVTGLEPHFLLDYDPKLYWLWHHISLDGTVCEKETCSEKELFGKPRAETTLLASQIIKNVFKSDYVISPRKSSLPINILLTDSKVFERVYTDRWYQIYKIKE